MPKRTRDRLVWGIGKVCEETSFSRANVEYFMRTGRIRAFSYQGELVTTPEEVGSFLSKCLDGTIQEIFNGDTRVVASVCNAATTDATPNESPQLRGPVEDLLESINDLRHKHRMPPLRLIKTKQKPRRTG